MAFRSSRSCPDARPAAVAIRLLVCGGALLLTVIAGSAPVGAQRVAESLEDLRVATAVRLALATDPFTAGTEAVVRARAGAVVVDASWPSAGAESRAEALAAGVMGVESVAMGDAPPRPVEALGEGVAVEPDEPFEAPPPDPTPEPVMDRLPAQQPSPPPTAEPAPAPAAAVGEPEVTHIVLLGDTLFSIARRYGTTVEAIQRLNDLGDSTTISLGQRLRIR